MVYSTWELDVEVGEGAGGAAEVVVEPDAGGEGEEFGGDAGAEAVEGAGVVAFEAEAVFEGPEARFDALADWCEVGPAFGLVFARGAKDLSVEAFEDGGGEVFAGVAFVGDDDLAAVQAEREQAQRDVAFFLIGGREDRRPGCAVWAARRCRRMPQNQRLWLRL